MSNWYFDTYQPQDKRRDPIQGEFFSSETISDPGRALVREGIQNSLDAAVGNEPVLVRIFVSGESNARSNREISEFFAGGWEHFRAPNNGLRETPEDNESCKFLVFEDFNTKGLTGNISEVPRGRDHKNAFAHFFRADGISDKGEGDRGSWGVGKTVFQRSSRLNVMFGLTVRYDDKKHYLMGMSVLKGHQLNNQDYKPDGWFGVQKSNGMIMPLEDSAILEKFRKSFMLERGSESGLSIVVPWLDSDVTEQAIVEAVLRDYFYPVMTGRLEVIVKTPSTEITVSQDSLDKEIARIGGDLAKDLQPLIGLARWSLEQGPKEIPKLGVPDPRKAMEWNESLIPMELRPILTKQLLANEKLAVRVPVNIREKNKQNRESFFDIFLIRDGSDRNDRPIYVRDGLIIPDVHAPRSRGITSLVIIKDLPIATFLGDAENPSHTQWQHDSSHFKGKYKAGAARDLKFVSDSVRNLVRLLTESENDEDRNLLSDIFNLPEGAISGNTRVKEKKGAYEDEKETIEPPKKRIFNITRQPGGFVVTANPSIEPEKIPPYIEILAAYEVRKGNAFNRYIPEDFDFKNPEFNVDTMGSAVLSLSSNQMTAKLINKDFRISITGFDEKRDVRVKVTGEEVAYADSIA